MHFERYENAQFKAVPIGTGVGVLVINGKCGVCVCATDGGDGGGNGYG